MIDMRTSPDRRFFLLDWNSWGIEKSAEYFAHVACSREIDKVRSRSRRDRGSGYDSLCTRLSSRIPEATGIFAVSGRPSFITPGALSYPSVVFYFRLSPPFNDIDLTV